VTTLRFEDFQLREGHWVIADLRGKGGHIRTIPVPEWVKAAVDRWTLAASINAGPLLRSINKAGKIWGDGFTPKVIWAIVKANAKSCGLPTVAPHDLRRTCARLCHQAGGELEQIQFLLGHVSIQQRSDTSGASSVSAMRSTITLVWNQMRHHDRRLRES
jgi:integrase